MSVGKYDEASNGSLRAVTAITAVTSRARIVLRDRLDVEAGFLLHLSLAGRSDEALIRMEEGNKILQELITGPYVVGLVEAASRYDAARAVVNLSLRRGVAARECALTAAERAESVLLKGHRGFLVGAAVSWAIVSAACALENLTHEAELSAERALLLLAENLESQPRRLPRGVVQICSHLLVDEWRLAFPKVYAALEDATILE